jgi:hypothetical protein
MRDIRETGVELVSTEKIITEASIRGSALALKQWHLVNTCSTVSTYLFARVPSFPCCALMSGFNLMEVK